MTKASAYWLPVSSVVMTSERNCSMHTCGGDHLCALKKLKELSRQLVLYILEQMVPILSTIMPKPGEKPLFLTTVLVTSLLELLKKSRRHPELLYAIVASNNGKGRGQMLVFGLFLMVVPNDRHLFITSNKKRWYSPCHRLSCVRNSSPYTIISTSPTSHPSYILPFQFSTIHSLHMLCVFSDLASNGKTYSR